VRVDLGANNITIRSPLTINGSFVVDSAGMIVNDTSLTINGALTLDIDNSSCTLSSFLSIGGEPFPDRAHAHAHTHMGTVP
jgi:hypothetical protein